MTPFVRLLIALGLWLGANAAHAECRAGGLDALPGRPALHLPAPLAPAPLPLVLLLHGSTGTGAGMLRDSGFADTADRHGFVVVAPDGGIASGGGYVWNIPGVPTVAGTLPPADARDDVAYLLGLVDRLVATGCVDAGRVYATGVSGGGRMASLLGCVAAHRLAAIAPVVGLRAGRPLASNSTRPDPATCRPNAALPVLAFAGDADATNPIAGGGAAYWRYSQAAALRRWAVLDGCAESYTRNVAATVYEQGYARCRDGIRVAVRMTRGGTHNWSVADNEAMWAFMSAYHR